MRSGVTMPLIVPDQVEVIVLNDLLTSPLTMRLYGNNITPSGSSTTVAFNEIAGGGYTSFALPFADWTITSGISKGVFNTLIEWLFTGTIDAPGSIYGYYVTRDFDNQLMWAQRFPSANVPFAPVNGSKIKVQPRIEVVSQF